MASEVIIAKPNNVLTFDEEYIALYSIYVYNSTEYSIFHLGNGNYWHYKEGDLIHLDSSTVKILDVDPVENNVSITEVDFIPFQSDTSFKGYWVGNGGYGVFEKSTLKMISNTLNSATFTYYKMNSSKEFTSGEDTCIIEGTKLIYLHIVEQTLPVVNCRDIIIRDTAIDFTDYRFSIKLSCFSEIINISGALKGSDFKIEIKTGEYIETEYLLYNGQIDSATITLSLGETYIDLNSNVSFTLDWSSAKDFLTYVGFKIYPYSSNLINNYNSIQINQTHNSISCNVYYFNLLGKKISLTNKHSAIRISKQIDYKYLLLW